MKNFQSITKKIINNKKSINEIRQQSRMNSTSKVNITSYNVLSSSLCEPGYFIHNKAEHLDATKRLVKVKSKLEDHIDSNSIICLQEVSHSWSGALHPFFAKRGYHFVTGLYGNKFNGYMGVGMAVPLSIYDILDVDIQRVGDTLKYIKGPKLNTLEKMMSRIKSLFLGMLKLLNIYRPVDNPWKQSADRFNQIICMRLKSKSPINKENNSFVVGTYHMPCNWQVPPMMMIHCVLSSQHIHKFANGDPYVYTGDFNIKPDSPMYKMITEGSSDDKESMPFETTEYDMQIKTSPLRSAYKVSLGSEPEFTNWAQTRNDSEAFKDTLDYVFISDEWNVESVIHVPNSKEITGPFPIATEPSDHLLIGATLSLKDN